MYDNPQNWGLAITWLTTYDTWDEPPSTDSKVLVQQPPGSPAENVIQHPDKCRCKWCGRFLPKRRRRLAETGSNISWVPFWSPFRIQNHLEKGHRRILRRIQTDPFFHSSGSLNQNYLEVWGKRQHWKLQLNVSAPKKVFPTRCITANSTWQCNIRHLQWFMII